jgi:hypothetical protein
LKGRSIGSIDLDTLRNQSICDLHFVSIVKMDVDDN